MAIFPFPLFSTRGLRRKAESQKRASTSEGLSIRVPLGIGANILQYARPNPDDYPVIILLYGTWASQTDQHHHGTALSPTLRLFSRQRSDRWRSVENICGSEILQFNFIPLFMVVASGSNNGTTDTSAVIATRSLVVCIIFIANLFLSLIVVVFFKKECEWKFPDLSSLATFCQRED